MPPQNPSELVTKLIHALSSQDVTTRRDAIRSLGQQGPDAADALPELREALKDPDFVIRFEAAVAIGFIGTKNDTEYLLPLLDDEVEAVRFQTISAIAYLQDAQATPELICRYDQETIHIQDQILRALGHLGGKEAFTLLEREIKAENPSVRTGAVVGFSFLGDSKACTLLQEIASSDSDELVAHEARIALFHLEAACVKDAKKNEK